tara:strand:+ start:335 stop:457 length:123 start_codon:yes stop_codon:yes gene_type:complete
MFKKIDNGIYVLQNNIVFKRGIVGLGPIYIDILPKEQKQA